MNSIDLSIIIPVYNIPEKLLRDSLDSVLKDKPQNLEVIIVDDGSIKDVAAICDEYKCEDQGIFVFHQENQGVSVARNKGVHEAHGQYIAFVDSDDYIQRDNLINIARCARIQALDICFFKFIRNGSFKEVLDSNFKIEIKDESFENLIYSIAIQKEIYDGYCLGSPWGKVFKREFIINNELLFLKSLRKMQDRVFMMYCLNKKPSIGFLPVEAYCYVVNTESIVNKYNPQIGGYINNVFKEILLFNDTTKLFKAKDLGTIAGKLIMEYLSLDILHKGNTKNKTLKIKELRDYLDTSSFAGIYTNFNKNEFDRNSLVKLLLIKYGMYRLLIALSGFYSMRR